MQCSQAPLAVATTIKHSSEHNTRRRSLFLLAHGLRTTGQAGVNVGSRCSQVKALFQKLEVDAKVIELDEVVEGDDVQVPAVSLPNAPLLPRSCCPLYMRQPCVCALP